MTKSKDIVEFINATYCNGQIVIFGSMLRSTKSALYELPISSINLDIYKCNPHNKNDCTIFQLNDLHCK